MKKAEINNGDIPESNEDEINRLVNDPAAMQDIKIKSLKLGLPRNAFLNNRTLVEQFLNHMEQKNSSPLVDGEFGKLHSATAKKKR